MEYLDIVDEKDKVIGRGTRINIHKKHKIHRGIHVFVVNLNGEILIQQRSLLKDYCPGYYDASVGAQVLSGETYEEAAYREISEELGVSDCKLKFIKKYKSFSERQKEIRSLFITNHEGPFKIQKDEVAKIEFHKVNDIVVMQNSTQFKFTKGFKLSFQYYIEFLRKNK